MSMYVFYWIHIFCLAGILFITGRQYNSLFLSFYRRQRGKAVPFLESIDDSDSSASV